MKRLAWALLLCGVAPRAGAAPAWPDLQQVIPVGGGEQDGAVIAAVEDYPFVPAIAGARANATAWYRYLVRSRGASAERVRFLRDREVTRERLQASLRAAAQATPPGGTLWFVYIGHGAPKKDGRDGLLLGVDAQQDPESMETRGLSRSEALQILAGTRAARIVVVLDACFSGRGSDGRTLAAGLMPLVAVREGPVLDPRTILLTAARADEFAGALPGVARPAFSYLVLGGLRGWADGDGDGIVTALELERYAREALGALVHNRKQTPTLEAKDRTVALARAGERGPDLAALVERAAPVPVRLMLSTLPEVPAPPPPVPLAISSSSLVDVEVVLLYDRAVRAEKSGSVEERIAAWQALAEHPRGQPYREEAVRRARAWKERQEAERARAEETRRLWQQVKEIARASVLGIDQKAELVVQAFQRLGVKGPGHNALGGGGADLAERVHAKACASGIVGFCEDAARRWAHRDPARALEYFRRACGAGSSAACYEAAVMLRVGRGHAADLPAATALLRRACDGNVARACSDLAELWLGSRREEALKLAARSCDLGGKELCDPSTAQAPAFRRALLEEACKNGSADNCLVLALELLAGGRLGEAMHIFGRACMQKGLRSCDPWRKRLESAGDRPAALGEAISCLADSGACFERGSSYWFGKGVTMDRGLGVRHWRLACEIGHAEACALLRRVRFPWRLE
jgi:TPR repeat protein